MRNWDKSGNKSRICSGNKPETINRNKKILLLRQLSCNLGAKKIESDQERNSVVRYGQRFSGEKEEEEQQQ